MAGTFGLNGGDVSANSFQGNGVPFTLVIGTVTYASADQTPGAAIYQCPVIFCTGTNGMQQKLILPLVAGASYQVVNSGTGYGIQVIGGSGNGIVIANNKVANVWSDGTNYYRSTLDSTITT